MRPTGSVAASSATAGLATVSTRRSNCLAASAASLGWLSGNRAAVGLPCGSTPNSTTGRIAALESELDRLAFWVITHPLESKKPPVGSPWLGSQQFGLVGGQTALVSWNSAIWASAARYHKL